MQCNNATLHNMQCIFTKCILCIVQCTVGSTNLFSWGKAKIQCNLVMYTVYYDNVQCSALFPAVHQPPTLHSTLCDLILLLLLLLLYYSFHFSQWISFIPPPFVIFTPWCISALLRSSVNYSLHWFPLCPHKLKFTSCSKLLTLSSGFLVFVIVSGQ